MPQVPAPLTDVSTRKQSAPNVRMSTDAPIEAFGGGSATTAVGQAGVQLGKQVERIAREERDKANDVATTEAYAKTVQLRNRLMYDTKTGAMNRKGKDAFGIGEEYGTEFEKGADEIEATLTNDDQRAMYKKIRTREMLDLDGSLTRHTFQQAQAYDEETTKAAIGTAAEDAVMNYQDPAKVQRSLSLQKSLIMEHARRNGLSPEAVQQRVMESESKTHEAVINRMLANGDDLRAAEYYKSVKPSILGSDATQLEKALEEGSIRGESQRLASGIVAKSGEDMRAALAQVDKIKDPKVQDATRERVKARFNEIEAAERLREEDAFKSAYTIAEQTKSKDSIPPGTWAQMTPAQRSAVDAYLKRDDKTMTDWGEYYNLKLMAGNPALRDKFMQTDLMMVRHKMGDSEWKELVSAQTDAAKGDTTKLDGFRSDMQIVNDALAEAGIDPTPKQGSTAAERVNNFRKRVDEEVAKKQKASGKKITNEEMQGIVDGLMIKGVTEKGFFWDTEKRFFELERGKDTKFDFEVKDIPRMDRMKIENALKANGLPITDDQVLRLYRQKLSGMVGR